MTFALATPSQGTCSHSSGTVSCSLGELTPAATATIELRVTPTQPAALVNSATVRSDQTADGLTASAETTVSDPSCGQVISVSATLTGDIGPCPGDGLVVGADDITLDLGGHRVLGFPGPGDGHQAGIRLTARTGVTVTNGAVEDFDAGVFVDGGASNTVSALTVRDDVGPDNSTQYEVTLGDGILVVRSSDNRIVGNTVSHNGPYDGIGILGLGSNLNTIDANTVERTVGTADGYGAGQGVILNAFLEVNDRGPLLEGNRITNNVVRDNASAGLSNFNNAGATIEGNTVERNGFTNRGGNGIALRFGPGVPLPVSASVVRANQVHGNAMDGIQVSVNANTNQIVDNDASDNNAAPYVDGTRRGFDL